MTEIKTFELFLTEGFLSKIKATSRAKDITMHKFIVQAIQDKLNEGGK